jgi:putative lipase involved disintegration of autophagic bodies
MEGENMAKLYNGAKIKVTGGALGGTIQRQAVMP